MKKSANHLIVDKSYSDDNSIASLNPSTMQALQLCKGDTIAVRSNQGKDTILVAIPSENAAQGKIRINQAVRNNLRLNTGDIVTVQACRDIKYGKRIYVLPFEDSIQGLTADIFQEFLKPYFLECYRPVRKGDTFLVKGADRSVEFKVIETDPAEYCIVDASTVIHTEGLPVKSREI